MVKVYHFKVYDAINDEWVMPVRKSPADRIKEIRGEIVPGTEEEVPESDLDEHRRYDPRPEGDRNA